jgi:hypothetical protein
MKKYYLIRLAYDFGYWNEELQDFKGFMQASKYSSSPARVGLDQFVYATTKKPCIIEEVFYNE